MTSRRTASTNGPTRVAAIHEGAGSVALVIVEPSTRPTVVLTRECGTLAQAERLMADHGVSKAIRIVPSSQTLLRVSDAPEAGAEETLATLELMAEAEFSEHLPAHRRGGGVLPGKSEAGVRRALLIGWPESDASPEPLDVAEVRWVAEIAALARIRGISRQPAWSLDAARGSVSVLAERNGHISCRAVRAEHDSPEAWQAAARSIIEETTRAVGSSSAPIELDNRPRAIELEQDAARAIRSSVTNVPDDQAWFDKFGLALGAALVELDDDPLVRAFAELRATPAREQVATAARLGTWLSVPSNAAIAIVACIIVAVLAPLGLAWARLTILDAKVSGLEEAQAQREVLEAQAAMYSELDSERLPMTKLLADIAGAAPVHAPDLVLIDLVRMTSEREVYIEGIADTAELVSSFQKNLNESGLFQGVTVTRSDASSEGVDFTLTARVNRNPYRSVAKSEETDYIARSTAVRLYGEDAVARSIGSTRDAIARNQGAGNGAAQPRRERPNQPSDEDESSTRGRPARVEIPEPLTDDALNAMSRAEVMMGFAKRRNIVQSNPDLDDSTKQRIEDEVERMRKRLDELRGGE